MPDHESDHFTLPSLRGMLTIDKVISAVLILAIVFGIGAIYYLATHNVNEKFTEFYILGPGGKAEGYPTDLAVGERRQVIVGMVNHEYATVKYIIQIKMGNAVKSTTQPIALVNEQKYEAPVIFSVDKPGQNQEVEFLLFREGDAAPYRSLRLWVNVHAPGASSVANSPDTVTTHVYKK